MAGLTGKALERLLRPRSIAVVGGGAWCRNVIQQCMKMGFGGPVWPVHPSRQKIADLDCVPSLDALPGAPDAVFVGVNRHATIGVVRQLSEMGAGGAVCFAAGFSEAAAELNDGPGLQAELLHAASGMPFLGPNCYGFINYLDGALLWPDQQGGRRTDRGVAIVTQSSNMAINMTMGARGLDLAYIATAGNQAAVGLPDLGVSLLDDPRVSALGLHIEGIGDLDAFEAMARHAHELGKPVVVLKVGDSEAAQIATVSHTASLAGSSAGAGALFARLGLAQVSTIEAFLEALKIAHVHGFLSSNAIASMSCSGGEASLIADLAERAGLNFPELSSAQHAALQGVLGDKVRTSNPLDYNTYIWPDTEKMSHVFSAVMSDDIGLGIVVLDFPRRDRCSDADWAHVVDAVEKAKAESGRPIAILASMTENLPEHWAEDCARRGILPLCGMGAGLEAVSAMSKTASPASDPILKPRIVKTTVIVGEAEAKAKLASHGLDVPRNRCVTSVADAAVALQDLGFPVVVKGVGHAHKTEAGAVRVGLASKDEVETAIRSISGNAWLLEEMITNSLVELLVGVTLDPAHGYVLTLGAGGQWTEIIADTVNLLLPVTESDIRAALGGLRVAPLLDGYRGQPPADMVAIIRAVLAVQNCVVEANGKIVEVEVNPLIAGTERAVAADALIVMEDDP